MITYWVHYSHEKHLPPARVHTYSGTLHTGNEIFNKSRDSPDRFCCRLGSADIIPTPTINGQH